MIKRTAARILFSLLILGGIPLECASAWAAPINEVKITGLPTELSGADQVEVLKTISGFIPGDETEPVRLQRATQKFKEYFEAKGYPHAEITPVIENVHQELPEPADKRVLFFKVVPGQAIRVSEVNFILRNQKMTPEISRQLVKAVEFKPGELFDRDRVKEMRKLVESSLVSNDFVDSRVVDVKTEEVNGELQISFVIELGQRVIFSVYGDEYFTRSELMSLIEEQRAVGLGRDYLNVVLNRLRDRYIEYGFRNVVITPYTFEPRAHDPRKVVYQINEGAKVMIHHIVFDGNESFTKKQLEGIFYSHAPDRIQAKIYNEKMVDEAAHSMIEELKNRGYLSAKLIAIKSEDIDEDPNDGKLDLKNSVEIKIFINEGLQTKVQSIDFRNSHVFSNEKLIEFLGLKEGSPLSLLQLENGIDRIKREYRNQGRLNMVFSNEATNQIVSYSGKNQYAYLNFEIDEGAEIRLADIQIFGNETTHRSVIEKEIRIKPGEPLAENKVLETEARLRRLGIFSQVNVELIDSPQANYKILKLTVQEATPGNMSAGLGFRNDLGARVFGQIGFNNLWGLDHSWVLDLSTNRRFNNFHFTEYQASVSYIWPYFIFGETMLRPSLSVEKRQYIKFDAETYGLSTSLERMLYRPLKITGMFTYTLEQVREFNAVDPTLNQQVRIGSITPLLRVDLRDNPLVPQSGFFGLTSFEYANTFLGTQSDPVPLSYGRFQARTDYYLNFIPHIVWYSSIRGGWLKNFDQSFNANGTPDNRSSIPLIKQFALGGINSLRGYIDQELNVQQYNASARVANFSTYVNYRTQMDYMAGANLSIGPFLDAGNLQVDNFSLGNLRYGTGLGLRYLTPVGPINFDWGFKLFPREGEQSNVFYFSLGVI